MCLKHIAIVRLHLLGNFQAYSQQRIKDCDQVHQQQVNARTQYQLWKLTIKHLNKLSFFVLLLFFFFNKNFTTSTCMAGCMGPCLVRRSGVIRISTNWYSVSPQSKTSGCLCAQSEASFFLRIQRFAALSDYRGVEQTLIGHS